MLGLPFFLHTICPFDFLTVLSEFIRHPGELSEVRFSKYTNAETLPRALLHVCDLRKNMKQIKILKRHRKFYFLYKLDSAGGSFLQTTILLYFDDTKNSFVW